MEERISCDCKCKFNSAVCNSNKKWNNKHISVNVKIIVRVKKIIVGILACVFFENSKYLKSTSVTECDDIVSVMDTVSTKNTNMTSTPSIHIPSIKVRDCHSLHTVLLAIILLLISLFFCYQYIKEKVII